MCLENQQCGGDIDQKIDGGCAWGSCGNAGDFIEPAVADSGSTVHPDGGIFAHSHVAEFDENSKFLQNLAENQNGECQRSINWGSGGSVHADEACGSNV